MTREGLWIRAFVLEVELRTQGSRPRTDLPRTDPLEDKDRNARGQGQIRTQRGSVPPPKKGLRTKKKIANLPRNFRRSQKKKGDYKFSERSLAFSKTKKKKVLTLAHFGGFEATGLTFEAKAKDFIRCPRGLHL